MFVASDLIRPLDTGPSSPSRLSTRFDEPSSDFQEGDKVEVLYKGKGTKWFSGKISRVNRDDTYDIRYDDGDSEAGALKVNVRRHPDAAARPSGVGSTLREGMKVEARFRGKERYYKGVLKRENRDGTWDVDYDDVCIHSVYLCTHYISYLFS